MKKWMWFGCGLGFGLLSLSLAFGAVPNSARVTDDTAIYQNLSEIRVPKASQINFDSEIARLSQSEKRYSEKLPSLSAHPRISAPMKRVASQNYRYAGN